MLKGQDDRVSSLEFLKVINELRLQNGQNKLNNNHFITRIEDELDDLGGYKSFITDSGGTPQKYYDLNTDQMMLVGMRESKVVRKGVLAYIKKLQIKLPQTLPEALRAYANQVEETSKVKAELQAASNTIKENEPKVVFANSVSGSSNSILIRQFAKDLCDENFTIGQNKLFEWLRENKYINGTNEPYQNYIEMGLFEVITRSVGSGTETFTAKTTKITGKGQVYFAKKIKS